MPSLAMYLLNVVLYSYIAMKSQIPLTAWNTLVYLTCKMVALVSLIKTFILRIQEVFQLLGSQNKCNIITILVIVWTKLKTNFRNFIYNLQFRNRKSSEQKPIKFFSQKNFLNNLIRYISSFKINHLVNG